jgi:hypothetical protein
MTSVYLNGSAEPFAASGISFEWGAPDPEPEPAAFEMPRFEASFTAQLEHAALVKLMDDVFGGRESLHGAAACACHQLPFPAARDYRRRTRNRRRR